MARRVDPRFGFSGVGLINEDREGEREGESWRERDGQRERERWTERGKKEGKLRERK